VVKTAGNLFFASGNAGMAQFRQSTGVAFAFENRSDDGLPSHSADIADRIGQLHIHFRQRLLHVLYTSAAFFHVPAP
jgi:hypothetical protein